MAIGRVWPVEWENLRDPVTGVPMRRLMTYKCHSHHLYFTNSGWYDGAKRLLLASDRENRSNLYSIDLQSGEMLQVTDLAPVPGRELEFLAVCVNPKRREAYFWYGRSLMRLEFATLDARPIWEAPEGFRSSMVNCTADGKYVCFSILEDLSARMRVDYTHGYVGFEETWRANPTGRLIRAATDGSGGETLLEEQTWINHVNTSPTQANLLTFCHEGPWVLVDNRIWVFDLKTRRAWKVRPRESGEMVGHEYWHADGIHIGYHGRHADGSKFFGRVRYDNTGRVEMQFPHETGHIHSNDFNLIVGHTSRDVRLWKWNGKDFGTPRALCTPRSSGHIQILHVHPRFSPDGRQVLFTSDTTGYGCPYLADVPEEFESLPEIKGV